MSFGRAQALAAVRPRRHSAGSNSWPQFVLSADGRLVVFRSSSTNIVAGDTNRLDDVFVYDRAWRSNIWDTTHARWDLHTIFGGGSTPIQLTPNGRHLLFTSTATGFVSGVTFPLSVRLFGPNGSMSSTSIAAQVYVHDLWSNKTAIASVTSEGFDGWRQ